MRHAFLIALLPLALPAGPSFAQDDAVVARSQPSAQPMLSTVPKARDIAWTGGAMLLEVDATDTARRIIQVKQTIPVTTSGPLTLLFPQWLPGKHAPRGEIEKLAGLTFTADGKPIDWQRDSLDVNAFHLSVPDGAQAIVATFQFLAPTAPSQGRVIMTDNLINLQWNSVSLYPAGFYVRRLPIRASVTLPRGWTAATALHGTQNGDVITYEQTDYETLVDSPIFAGRNSRRVELAPGIALNIFADTPEELAATPEQIALHRRMVEETLALFGARHFDHYDFLLSISDTLGGIGLEHHRESEDGVKPGYFTKWAEKIGDRDLLPHEFTHSWNGKYRRPELLWTPDYATPMQDDLLWVYEGQTQLWGYVLAARSGLLSKSQALDALAAIAARLDNTSGRQWRPLDDTTLDPIIAARRPKSWPSWQRSEDYYNEGLMIWLEADAIIQRESNGTRSLDDFAKAFFGMNNGDWGVLTYGRSDVVEALNNVVPYDWDGFLRDRIDRTNQEVTKAGFTLGGYRLVYGAQPNAMIAASESSGKMLDQSFGVGLVVGNDGAVQTVVWDSSAFKAGLTIGDRIIAINGIEYSADLMRSALAATGGNDAPLSLLIKQDKRYSTITLDYSGGLRYPRLERQGEGESSLDRLLQARTGATPVS